MGDSASAIADRLRRYVAGEISLQAFRRNFWGDIADIAEADKSADAEIAWEAAVRIAEFEYGGQSEDSLRDDLSEIMAQHAPA